MKNKAYITIIIDLLKIDKFYGIGETIALATSNSELPEKCSGILNTLKRNKNYE